MNETEFRNLYNRYVHNKCTPEEAAAFLREAAEREEELKKLFDVSWKEMAVYPGQFHLPPVRLSQRATVRRIQWAYYVAAAVLLGCMALTGWWLFQSPALPHTTPVAVKADLPPGREGGILTLSNGKTILLDNAANGALAEEGGAAVTKKEGVIAYEGNGAAAGEAVYNMITTPRGRQYSLVLADGSKVWLNAGSSVRYPAAFTGKRREVEVTGEVYFEVAKDEARPFLVTVNNIQVQVLGTRFNINANEEEGLVKAALLQGAVKVVSAGKALTLAPGQQALAAAGKPLQLEKNANMDEVMAWRNGYFHFESADLKTILRQFSLWYDIDVKYEGHVKERRFFAIVKRAGTLNSVLQLLKDQDIQFRLEGRTLIVKQE